ncbi:MAG TPA: hypothetical protein VEL74_08395 [Thermoanaerobaculia bacterium]|nr:hypothetical protein [Thermoanaerobaculia bacterium]
MHTVTEVWGREWEEHSLPLFELLQRAERGGVTDICQLLRHVRHCRTTLTEAPTPRLQGLAVRTLDELWEAARLTLYGDLGLADEHTAAAWGHAQKIHQLLSDC